MIHDNARRFTPTDGPNSHSLSPGAAGEAIPLERPAGEQHERLDRVFADGLERCAWDGEYWPCRSFLLAERERLLAVAEAAEKERDVWKKRAAAEARHTLEVSG